MTVDIHTRVQHSLYGKGEVVKITDDKLYVSFGNKQRIFQYPDAFEKGYLSADIEIESVKETPSDELSGQMPETRKKTMKKPSVDETVETFSSLTKEYGVLDSSKSGGGHNRFRLGKEGSEKALFLACSRAGWMRVYIDKGEKALLENNGFPCEPTRDDEGYDYRTRVNSEDFDFFLKLVQKHLGR